MQILTSNIDPVMDLEFSKLVNCLLKGIPAYFGTV